VSSEESTPSAQIFQHRLNDDEEEEEEEEEIAASKIISGKAFIRLRRSDEPLGRLSPSRHLSIPFCRNPTVLCAPQQAYMQAVAW